MPGPQRTIQRRLALFAALVRAGLSTGRIQQATAGRARTMMAPTLLMAGSKSASPELKRSIDSLRQTLPHSTLRIFEGQEHNAMDTIPQEFAATVASFLLEPRR